MDRINKKLAGKDVFMALDESEVSKNKYINVLVDNTAEPEKRMSSTAALWRLSINTLSQQRVTTALRGWIHRETGLCFCFPMLLIAWQLPARLWSFCIQTCSTSLALHVYCITVRRKSPVTFKMLMIWLHMLKHLLWRTRPADKCSVTLEALLNRLSLAGLLATCCWILCHQSS